MIFFYIALFSAIVGTVIVIAFGLYEFFLENRHDMDAVNQRGQELHLKHLDQINQGK